MKKFRKLAARLVRDERGQTTTEYILILAVVVMVAMKFRSVFGDRLTSIVNNLGTQIDQATTPSQ